MQTLLGIEPDALRKQLRLRPYLPDWLTTVQVRGMRIAGQTVDFDVRGHRADVDVRVSHDGDLMVTVGPA